MLTQTELDRYGRQIMMAGFGEAGQEKLKNAKVFIAGAGGLGSPISIYLANAGIGTMRIVDCDTIELSNLNRQILHWPKDVGRAKVDSAREKLSAMNPDLKLEALKEYMDESNIYQLTEGFDIIVDAMDNIKTRYLLNKAALDHNIPFVHGAIYGLEGRAMTVVPGKSACLGCVYKGVPPKAKFPVLGVTPAVIGSIEATEVIKYLTGIGELLIDRILIYDGLNMKFMEVTIKKNPECEFCGPMSARSK
jgi:molybdopterin/thiamine biosynthesis adenylyltransferase